MPQLAERACLELADALARDAEPLPHLFERLRSPAASPKRSSSTWRMRGSRLWSASRAPAGAG